MLSLTPQIPTTPPTPPEWAGTLWGRAYFAKTNTYGLICRDMTWQSKSDGQHFGVTLTDLCWDINGRSSCRLGVLITVRPSNIKVQYSWDIVLICKNTNVERLWPHSSLQSMRRWLIMTATGQRWSAPTAPTLSLPFKAATVTNTSTQINTRPRVYWF